MTSITGYWRQYALSSPADRADLNLWLDADDAASFTLSGSAVSQWNDKSGHSRHASQGTSGNRPARTGTLNGRSTVVFDGTNDYLSIASGIEPRTIFAVARSNTNGTHEPIMGCARSGGSPDLAPWYFKIDTSGLARRGEITRVTSVETTSASDLQAFGASQFTQNTWHILGANVDPDSATRSVSLFVDSNVAAATDTSSNAPLALGSTMYVGASQYAGAVGDFLTGEIAEIVIYDRILTDDERAALFLYLKRKWGL